MLTTEQLKNLSVTQLRNGISKKTKTGAPIGYKTMSKSALIKAIIKMKHTGLNKELMKNITTIKIKPIPVAKAMPSAAKPKRMPVAAPLAAPVAAPTAAPVAAPVAASPAKTKAKPKATRSIASVEKMGLKALIALGKKYGIQSKGGEDSAAATAELRQQIISYLKLNKLV